MDSVPFCGTNAVLRRSALEALPNGGLPYASHRIASHRIAFAAVNRHAVRTSERRRSVYRRGGRAQLHAGCALRCLKYTRVNCTHSEDCKLGTGMAH